MHGKGRYYYANGDKYVGEFENGKKNGKGIMYWGAKSRFAGNRYDGEWKEDKMHGKGTYICADGSKYIGEMNNNFK